MDGGLRVGAKQGPMAGSCALPYGLVDTCAPRCGVLPHMYHTVPLIELHQLHLLELQVS
jgi:hypothetical protein